MLQLEFPTTRNCISILKVPLRQTWGLVGVIFAQGLVIAGLGCGIGLVVALVLGRVMQAFLFEIGASDPTTFLAASGLLAGTAVVASALPAIRAARVDPITSLRER